LSDVTFQFRNRIGRFIPVFAIAPADASSQSGVALAQETGATTDLGGVLINSRINSGSKV
jgi:hypothetical protein